MKKVTKRYTSVDFLAFNSLPNFHIFYNVTLITNDARTFTRLLMNKLNQSQFNEIKFRNTVDYKN